MTDPRQDVVFGDFGAVYVPGSGGVLPPDYDPEYGVPKSWVAMWRAEYEENNRYPVRLLTRWLARVWRSLTGGLAVVRVLVLLIVLGIVWWLLGYLPIPEPFHTVIGIVMILILIWEVLALVGYTRSVFPNPPPP